MLVIFDHITVIFSFDAFRWPRKFDGGDEASNILKSNFLGKSGLWLVWVYWVRFKLKSAVR